MKDKLNHLFFPNEGKENRFKALDGLRGLAILIVLMTHANNGHYYFNKYINFYKFSKAGVYLFFILSAYLLDRQIGLALRLKKASKWFWANYILRRILRIYPLYIISLFVYYFQVTYFEYHDHGIKTPDNVYITPIVSLSDILKHLLLIEGNRFTWTIPVEFKYYFISPVLMYFFHKYLKWNLKFIFFTIILLTIISTIFNLEFDVPVLSPFTFFPVFLMGTFFAILEILKRDSFTERFKSKKYDYIGLAAFAIIIFTLPFYLDLFFGIYADFNNYKFMIPYCLLWGFVFFAAKFSEGIIKKTLETKVMRFFGTISISLYLLHQAVLNMVRRMDCPEDLKIYLFFAFSILLSTAIYLILERPISKIKIPY